MVGAGGDGKSRLLPNVSAPRRTAKRVRRNRMLEEQQERGREEQQEELQRLQLELTLDLASSIW